jgi:hypothetical protein
LPVHPGRRHFRNLVLVQQWRQLGAAGVHRLERPGRHTGDRADRDDPVVLRKRPRLRRRPSGRFRPGAGQRRVLVGERRTSLLREPDVELPHEPLCSGARPRELDEEEAPERNLALREQGFAESGPVKGVEGIAVSRADNVNAANFNDKNVWAPPVIASKAGSNTQFADKEQIWADNAESSRSSGTSMSATARSPAPGRSR